MISQILIVLSDTEEILNSDSDEENKLLFLTKMELPDFICAAQISKVVDALLLVEDRKQLCNDPNNKQRRNSGYDFWKRKKQRKLEKKLLNEDDHAVHLSIPMIGSGVPTEPDQITQRTLPEDAIGSPYFYYEQIYLSNPMIGFGVHTKSDQTTQRTLPEDTIGSPYFYYENVALAPVNVWTGISQYLFDVEPEFVDSKHFHAATLKRGYIHNLPIENIFPLILKCQIDRKDLNKVTPLEPNEVEMLLEVAFYCLGISLKTDVQELNDDRLEQLMSRFVEFDLVVGGIQPPIYPTIFESWNGLIDGHNGYHLDKEIDQHGKGSNAVSRLEPASRYNQSAGSDLFMAL
ncbi:DNA (Cytosine-5)-methyltransferase DRM1/2 isoform 2 [Hibiscus syriacus]|uniref:DNA (Cytosine-5)-methyltransferase DRM1/2 isoform 2 n=1 Tax=Hibiscus syriacus TaxID=106335 RepID=A0A6A3C7D1_HIBSY|nr:DNA (Cytosine-5)-methyltransferase DRM1/2 isoform 2 [Hibiscus syriacus]